jgi:hypothetical protein
MLRTLILLHVVDMILETSIGPPPSSGCSQLDQISIPCSKAMWEAENRSAWEEEYKRYLRTRRGTEMLNYGHLRSAKETDLHPVERELFDDLSVWSKGMDSLGSLLLLATQR